MTHERHYRFAEQAFSNVVAHGGTGRIRTARVVAEDAGSAFQFIDLTEVPPGNSIGEHRHGDGDEEVYVIVSGRGRMLLDGAWFEVNPGDVIHNAPGGQHALVNSGQETLRIVVLDALVPSEP